MYRKPKFKNVANKRKPRIRNKSQKNRCQKKREKRDRLLDRLIDIRGIYCFYCGEEMHKKDMTIEHLVAKSNGGGNDIYNLYLAHTFCNREAGSKSINEKLELRNFMTEEAWSKYDRY